MDQKTTISAIATPPGQGGIGVIRISGPDALGIASKIFSKDVLSLASHTAHYGQIVENEEVIDTVLLLPMHAPRSYTGENTVEIHCHGGLMPHRVLDATIRAGAKPAGPGEFTYRAFLNGKIDLAQAEAVQSLIGAQNEMAMHAASSQLEGALSSHIQAFQNDLSDSAAILEAWVDFPEEGLEFASKEEIMSALEKVQKKMQKLHATFRDGKVIHDGLTLCLVGAPNVGKSSLMNALLGKDRAIVTSQAGTTRDVLEDEMRLGNLHFRMLDTAGMRKTDDLIEKEGVERSYKAKDEADLILWVLDLTRPMNEEEKTLDKTLPKKKTIVIWNKADLTDVKPGKLDFSHILAISAKCGTGLDELKSAIASVVWSDGLPEKGQVLLTEQRHHTALGDAIACLENMISGLATDISPEFLASDMRACLLALAQICGTDVSDDILGAIFSKFCVGK